ncbi:MAG: hypothetical protein ACR2KJ_10710 [Jatrophihabitans sp.]
MSDASFAEPVESDELLEDWVLLWLELLGDDADEDEDELDVLPPPEDELLHPVRASARTIGSAANAATALGWRAYFIQDSSRGCERRGAPMS